MSEETGKLSKQEVFQEARQAIMDDHRPHFWYDTPATPQIQPDHNELVEKLREALLARNKQLDNIIRLVIEEDGTEPFTDREIQAAIKAAELEWLYEQMCSCLNSEVAQLIRLDNHAYCLQRQFLILTKGM